MSWFAVLDLTHRRLTCCDGSVHILCYREVVDQQTHVNYCFMEFVCILDSVTKTTHFVCLFFPPLVFFFFFLSSFLCVVQQCLETMHKVMTYKTFFESEHSFSGSLYSVFLFHCVFFIMQSNTSRQSFTFHLFSVSIQHIHRGWPSVC